MAVVITHARTVRVPFSVSAAGVSVWMRTDNLVSVSNNDLGKESGQVEITPDTCQRKIWQTVAVTLQKTACLTKKYSVKRGVLLE